MTDDRRPAGTPVGRALDIPAGIVYDDLREVVAAIDRVHGDGELPRIPVRFVAGMTSRGRFRFDVDTGEPISISINPNQTYRKLALLHEIGHFLDWQSLGDGRDFGTNMNLSLANWSRVVARSRAYRELEDILRSGTAITHGDTAPRQLLTADELALLRSMARPEEYWARSYAQYIAASASQPAFVDGIVAFRRRHPGQVYYPLHWDDDDFYPIVATIDALFERLGWRR